jgi:hypothetical protein
MSDKSSTATPAWFRLWRGTMQVAAFCCAFGLVSIAPLSSAKFWTQIRWPIIQVLGWSIGGVIGIILASPAIGRVYTQPVGIECSFRVKIVAYVDQNQNGLRDMTEPGIANAPVTVTVGTKSWNPIHTDKTGIAEAKAYAFLCERGMSERVSAEVGPVGGYHLLSTLPLNSFGVTPYPNEPPEQVWYVGFIAQ